MKTSSLTSMGQMLLNRTTFLTLLLFGCISYASVLFYHQASDLLQHEAKQTLLQHAILASAQFDAEEIAAITPTTSLSSPELRSLVNRLEQVKQTIPNVFYVYILRPTTDDRYVEFVAENDMLYTDDQLDYNNNGTIDLHEVAVTVGEKYDISQAPYMRDAFVRPSVEEDFAYDSWGTWMSAYAPIRDENGKPVAIIGLDIEAQHFVSLSQRMLSPIYVLLFIGIVFVIALVFIALSHKKNVDFERKMRDERRLIVRQAISNLGDPISTLSYWTELLTDDDIDTKEAAAVLAEATTKLNAVVQNLNQITD
jgi:hypothetical protein